MIRVFTSTWKRSASRARIRCSKTVIFSPPITKPPPDSIIHIGDHGVHITVTSDTYLSKFEKLVALVDYGVRLAKVAAPRSSASSSGAASPVENPGAQDRPVL